VEFISRNNNKRKSEPEEIDDKTAVHTNDRRVEREENIKVNTRILINHACKYTANSKAKCLVYSYIYINIIYKHLRVVYY